MPLLDVSKISFAFKKLLGKSHTDSIKEPYNELVPTGISASASTIFADPISATPNTTLWTVTGAVEKVVLTLTEDPTSNGHAFFASLPANYESLSSNPKKGSGVFVNGQVLSATSGKLQIVPTLYGTDYEVKPYRGASLVPPGDVVDWLVNEFSGIIFQENDPLASPAAMTTLECYLYIGDMVSDKLAASGASAVGSSDVVVGTGTSTITTSTQRSASWFVTAYDVNDSISAEITAMNAEGTASYTMYGIKISGLTSGTLGNFSVVASGPTLSLRFTTTRPAVTIRSLQLA